MARRHELKIGDLVEVTQIQESDPYIFNFQRVGELTRIVCNHDDCDDDCDREWMIRLHSAWGEWGPVPIYRLVRLDDRRLRNSTAEAREERLHRRASEDAFRLRGRAT